MIDDLPEFLRVPQARRTLAWEEFLARVGGFFARLTAEQQSKALAYTGEDHHGDPVFKRSSPIERAPDRWEQRRKTQQDTRIAKRKAGLERKELHTAGALAIMPLQGKAALAAIRAAQKGRRK